MSSTPWKAAPVTAAVAGGNSSRGAVGTFAAAGPGFTGELIRPCFDSVHRCTSTFSSNSTRFTPLMVPFDFFVEGFPSGELGGSRKIFIPMAVTVGGGSRRPVRISTMGPEDCRSGPFTGAVSACSGIEYVR